MRRRPSSTKATAYDAASARKGNHRVMPYSAPPTGPPSRLATCWRAWFWLNAVGRSSVLTTSLTADISAGEKTPAPTPVSSPTTSRCGMVRWPSAPATTSDP